MIAEYWETPVFIVLDGFLAMGAGLLILAFRLGWTADWKALITLIG